MTTDRFENILAIDSSTMNLKLAASFGHDRLVRSEGAMDRSHGQLIVKKIGNLFESAGLQPSRLEGLVVSTGPGSFTGLRIGLALAKGMGVALRIPIVGVSHFELAASSFGNATEPIVAVVQVRRDEFLAGVIESGVCPLDSVTAVPRDNLDTYLAGRRGIGINLELNSALPTQLSHYLELFETDVAALLHLGRIKLVSGGADLAGLEPLYLQKSQAEIRFEQRQQKQ